MIEIWLEMHAQTEHNAAGIASGHYDVALTPFGAEQARSVLHARYRDQHFDAAFASNTQRAYRTACLMLAGRGIPVFQDARLRECDYGDFEGRPRVEMQAARMAAIRTPFPNGESYAEVAARMRSFLTDIAAERDGQRIMIVGHAATLHTLEHWLSERSLEDAVRTPAERPWRFTMAADRWQTS